jgi:hypothetical protein
MAQTAAHLADHVIPPVPVRQWVISVPKRLRGMLADRPQAVAALTKIFLAEVERLLLAASGVNPAANTPPAARPRLGAISFLHRFGSALNHHVHLHACVTDGVFKPAPDEAGGDGPPLFVSARPITPADLAALTERVRRRVIRWFRLARLLDAAAAADMLAWENSGFSIDASVRITLLDRDVPGYFQSLEHLLRYCARPPFAIERLSVIRDADRRCGRPSRRWPSGTLARGAGLWPAGKPRKAVLTLMQSPTRTTPPGSPGRNLWRGWGRSFRSSAQHAGATSGSSLSSRSRARSGRFSPTWANRSSRRRSRRLAGRPPTGASSCRCTFDRDVFQSSPDELPAIDIHSL